METTAFSQYIKVHSKSSNFNACSFTLSYFFIASSLMNNLDDYSLQDIESWRES